MSGGAGGGVKIDEEENKDGIIKGAGVRSPNVTGGRGTYSVPVRGSWG